MVKVVLTRDWLLMVHGDYIGIATLGGKWGFHNPLPITAEVHFTRPDGRTIKFPYFCTYGTVRKHYFCDDAIGMVFLDGSIHWFGPEFAYLHFMHDEIFVSWKAPIDDAIRGFREEKEGSARTDLLLAYLESYIPKVCPPFLSLTIRNKSMDRDLDEFVAVVQTDANGGDPTKREIAAGILRTISELIAEREQNSITDAEFKDVVEHLKATYYPPKGEATNGTH